MEQTYIERMSINLRAPSCASGKRWEEMIPMRDGIKLRTVFYMPDTEGPWPILLSRTPYPKNKEIYDYQGKIFSERGYGFICQYCRGTDLSEGKWLPFENEKQDGEDTLKWLERQSYIKSIGLYGFSYVAYTQWVVLDCLPPKVKTAYIVHFGTDRFRQMYCNGLFRHDIYTPWAKDNSGMSINLSYESALEAGRYKPHIEADRAVWNLDLPWYREWLTHPDYADDFWKKSFWEELKCIPTKVEIPIYLGCGWYDHHFGGMMEAYRNLSDYGKKHSYLVIGPWVHGKNACIASKNTDDAFASGIHGYEGALSWMDRCLLNEEIPNQEIQVYGIGQGWCELTEWPGKSEIKRLYFSEKQLQEENESETKNLAYTYDPASVIETLGAECMCYAPLERRGSVLQADCEERKDRISLISEKLDMDITLKGVVKVHLNVSTDVADTAFIVRLMEVNSEGISCNIRTMGTTLRYRNGANKAVDYIIGERVSCELEMWDILWTVPAGSRIRVDIASTSYPEYNIHLNTAEPWAEQKNAVIAHQKIWVGGENGSYIELPIEIAEY